MIGINSLASKLRPVLAAALCGLAFTATQASASTGNNFTMLDGTGAVVGGTNDVEFTWDGTLNTSVATAAPNATLSSDQPFFGITWDAHDVMVYGPGTYTIFTDCPAGSPDCGIGASYTVTVNPGQVMAHMLFDWGASTNIDVINVWEVGQFGPSPMFTGAQTTTDAWSGDDANIWTFTSIDWDGDGFNGSGMIDGPFPNFNANFNVMVVAATGGNNFTMLDGTGAVVGGTNDVAFTWDGTLNTSVATAAPNATLSSDQPFFGITWDAHDVMLYGPGTYTIFTDCPAGSPDCGVGASYTVTVNPGQVMAHMLFDWGASTNIDVIDVWEAGQFGPSPMFTGAQTTTDAWSGDDTNVWTFTSIDWDGDGFNGAGMIDGPFPNFNANFNVMATTGTEGGGTSTPSTDERTLTPPDIEDPSFGGGAATGLWSLLGLLGLALAARRRT
ncbi:hypothetical protein TspCOW1_19000 [Thiohalobacter sp. COW1]|uniref:hypothetical protein n=1 Tax=Thiohalobacter sp. COW1 TaxID=2795687 RepID=UPI0019151969|nr:hypothetical protein [Thiohalobacter sp. COW1]BCO31797.1 hypothetical protein TspCOW1_19000 [Thiohalobacter sp. COW1]